MAASCPEAGATSQEEMAFMMTDSGTGSSSGGEFCHLSIGVMRVSLLAGMGDPDRQIRAAGGVSILSFWRRRALANHVDKRFLENPVSRAKRAFSSSEGYGKSWWSRNHSFKIRTPLLTNCFDSFCLSAQLIAGIDDSASSPYIHVSNV